MFHLVDPGTVFWREIKDETRVRFQPLSHLFAVVRGIVIANDVDGLYVLRDYGIEVFEIGDEFLLALAFIALTIDATGVDVKASE